MAIHPETPQITGVHLLAPHAGDLVAQAMTIVRNHRNHNTIDDVLEALPIVSDPVGIDQAGRDGVYARHLEGELLCLSGSPCLSLFVQPLPLTTDRSVAPGSADAAKASN